jgi:hypothetical protein
MEFDRCSLVRKGVGESLAGAATCFTSAEPMVSCCDGGPCGPENEVDVGDFGAPKAVINERTMPGVSMHWAICLTLTWLHTSRAAHLGASGSFEARNNKGVKMAF